MTSPPANYGSRSTRTSELHCWALRTPALAMQFARTAGLKKERGHDHGAARETATDQLASLTAVWLMLLRLLLPAAGRLAPEPVRLDRSPDLELRARHGHEARGPALWTRHQPDRVGEKTSEPSGVEPGVQHPEQVPEATRRVF